MINPFGAELRTRLLSDIKIAQEQGLEYFNLITRIRTSSGNMQDSSISMKLESDKTPEEVLSIMFMHYDENMQLITDKDTILVGYMIYWENDTIKALANQLETKVEIEKQEE